MRAHKLLQIHNLHHHIKQVINPPSSTRILNLCWLSYQNLWKTFILSENENEKRNMIVIIDIYVSVHFNISNFALMSLSGICSLSFGIIQTFSECTWRVHLELKCILKLIGKVNSNILFMSSFFVFKIYHVCYVFLRNLLYCYF